VTPGRGVISIAAEAGSRLLKLEVADGKKVRTGDVLACLETQTLRAAERDAAKVALDEARERLEAETAYAEAVIEQSRQAVRLLEITVDRERKELKRFESLTSTKALPERRLEDQQFLVNSREAELAKANAELRAAQAALARTRSLVAVKSAEAQLKAAEAQLELTILRAPIDGEILKVFTYPGERIGNAPILKMGDTADMYVVAEVHETEVGAVRVGQRATATSAALAEPIHGVVEEIGALIYKNDVLDLDPRADKDTRIVEVRIKLDKSEAVARLTHLEVSTRIDLDTPATGAKSAAR
jgi:HlyD family secretion protein